MIRKAKPYGRAPSAALCGILLVLACLAGCAAHRDAGSVGVLLSSQVYRDAGEMYCSRWLYWNGHRLDKVKVDGWILLNREGRFAAMIPGSDQVMECRQEWLWVTRGLGNETVPPRPPCLDKQE